MRKLTGQELVQAYRANYDIPPDAPITEEMIAKHWDLERALTRQLLQSSPDSRHAVFVECYTRLYDELPWLNQYSDTHRGATELEKQYAGFVQAIGKPPARIYEIGSGKGQLINHLASCGFTCRGSDISEKRGETLSEYHANLTWGVTDGIHLTSFESEASFDVAISRQVIEHLHPDDLREHFRSAYQLLDSEGRYFFAIPHRWDGPTDVSKLFGCKIAQGMHLKEYLFREIIEAVRAAGFRKLEANVNYPRGAGRLSPRLRYSYDYSGVYLKYVSALEFMLGMQPFAFIRKIAIYVRLFPSMIDMIAYK